MKKIIYSFAVFLLLLGCQAMTEETAPALTGSREVAGQGADTQVKSGPYAVIKVVDGDTIDVDIGGQFARLRLIGINTPETVDPRKSVECFGKEASAKGRELLAGKKVYLEADPTQTDRDKYGRLLRYVFMEDGTNFGLLMIREGYAYEYTYDLPYKYQSQFKAAQTSASDAGKGLWAEGACP